MATSGNKSITVTAYDTLKFSWWFNSSDQSVANNTTLVRWKMELIAGTYGRISSSVDKDWSVTVNGTKYSGTNRIAISNNSTITLASGTTKIAHNSDGSKTFNYSFSQAFAITFDDNYIGTKSGSGSGTLDTIPRKSSLSVANGTLGTAQTLTVTRQSSSFTHTITAKCGTASTTICTKSTSTSVSFTPPLSWAKQNTTGTSVSVTYTITTYNGSTSVGSNSYTKTCSIPASVAPSCSLSVTDAMGYADTYGAYLKGLSKLKVVVTATTAQDSAIKSYKTTANGSTYTASSFTTGVLTKSGTLTVNTTVTDKRSRTGTASKNLTVLDYSAPRISALSVHRCNEDGTANDQGEFVQVVFSGSVTALNDNNTAKYTLEYKKTTDDTYTAVEFTDYADNYAVSDASYIFAADSGSSYNVRVTVADNFGNGAKATTASTGFTIMHWLASGLGMAIGKVAELANVLDIGFQTRFAGGILHPVLEPETDLDDVRTPNTYVGANISDYNYANCPLASGTFTLEVVGMGEAGQVKQRVTYCHKTAARAWERIYYQSAWGEWVCVSDFDGQLLWSGGYYMTDTQPVDLREPVSKQRSGIVLVFSRYDGESRNEQFSSFFIPKYLVSAHPGCGHDFKLGGIWNAAAKYLYIHDDRIAGHVKNDQTVTIGGITYTNNAFIMRYVIGV